MKKSTNMNTKVNKAIKMIRCGATWDDVSAELKLSIGYLQKNIKNHYKILSNYNKILAEARSNKKRKDEEARILAEQSQTYDKEVVNVMETGYLLKKGVQALRGETDNICIPYFNIKELEKLTNASEVASEILKEIYTQRRVTCIRLREDELVFEKPAREMKVRTYGIVAVCCYLWASGYHVKLLTNSREVEELANLQDIGIEVERVSN